jgi:hypothetical protein
MHDAGDLTCEWKPLVMHGQEIQGVSRCVRCRRFVNHKIGELPNVVIKCGGGRKVVSSQAKSPCRHLGEQRRLQECDSCKGPVQIKVLECAIHGECTIGKKLESIACCGTCDNYEKRL